jgi:tRNA 2-selenouridine synthase
MLQEIEIAEYYASYCHLPIIDVRSPGEYEKGHIPGSNSIPLFTNDERADVGTVYVRQSKEKAIELGYSIVTPKLQEFILKSEQIAPACEVVVHCWRGGMRSRSFAQHLHDNGFVNVYVITGGYKAFRNYVLNFFSHSFDLKVLGGYTGSGKTHILKELHKNGHQVIDLENIANHKGSAFGEINQPEQPTVEQFENNLFEAWRQLNASKPIWVEDESHHIGGVQIPMNLFKQIRTLPVIFLEIPREERAGHLVTEYANCDKDMLINSLTRISKRMDGLAFKQSLELLAEDKFYDVAMIALQYYDKMYLKGLRHRDGSKIIFIPLETTNAQKNAKLILNYLESNGRN